MISAISGVASVGGSQRERVMSVDAMVCSDRCGMVEPCRGAAQAVMPMPADHWH